MTAVLIAFGLVGLAVLLWVFFLAVMLLKQHKADLRGWVLWLAYSTLLVGWVLDFVVQVTVATALFLELPQELTVSARVKRLTTGQGSRFALSRRWAEVVALVFRDRLLKPFDASGGHD